MNIELHKIANEVDRLVISDPTARTVFTDHIGKLCKMVEDYGHAQQPYTKSLEEAKKQTEKLTTEQLKKYKPSSGKIKLPSVDICAPPNGYVGMNYWDNYCVNVPIGTNYRPSESVNPLLWFGIFFNTSVQRRPKDDESLMCCHVLLAIIHDFELQQPTDRPFFSDKYEGEWFQRDRFREAVRVYYSYPNQEPSLLYHSATPQEKLSQLNRAFEHVKVDIEHKKNRAIGMVEGTGNGDPNVGNCGKTIVINFEDFKDVGSRRLLSDLVDSPNGVVKKQIYGVQPGNLKRTLKAKYEDTKNSDYISIANALKTDRGSIVLVNIILKRG